MRTKLTLRLASLAAMLILATSCDDGAKELDTTQPPTITLDSSTNSYEVKINKEIVIAPTYENAEDALFSWKRDGEIVATTPNLTFSSDELGDFYYELEVMNSAGLAYKEIRISVLNLVVPSVKFTILGDVYNVAQGVEFAVKPVVVNCEDATFEWTLDDDIIATTQDLTYVIDELGDYELSLKASNEDGESVATIALSVMTTDELPFYWDFEKVTYNLSSGREVRVKCWNVANDFGGDYVWMLDGVEVQRGENSEFIFSESAQGAYDLVVTKYNAQDIEVATESFVINVCATEGTYKRPVTATSSNDSNKVYEFTPAPGQFVNNGYTATTVDESIAYAEGRLEVNYYVSLGGFGGCLVVGFDHSVDNTGGYDLEILGNPMVTSCEPGIVMVMQDENGDGLPNDTWYELRGSETVDNYQIKDYAITYYRPENGSDKTASYYYTNNYGGDGSVVKAFYSQDYWPAWIAEDTLKFYGTCLVSRTEEVSPGHWSNAPYDWGYVDNYSYVDMLSSSAEYINTPAGNHFRISDAIDYKGDAVDLEYIDFVKIYSGVSAQSGWLGEVSTEVLCVSDFNMNKVNYLR